jgi:hypothetical protein
LKPSAPFSSLSPFALSPALRAGSRRGAEGSRERAAGFTAALQKNGENSNKFIYNLDLSTPANAGRRDEAQVFQKFPRVAGSAFERWNKACFSAEACKLRSLQFLSPQPFSESEAV